MKPIGHIYLIRNKHNGKVYIGKTIGTVKQRWNEHVSQTRRGSRTHFHNAIRKYGRNAFDVVQLSSATTHDELEDMEKRTIFTHESTNRIYGYNITLGGGGSTGYKAPPDVRYKVSQSSKAMWKMPGFRQAMSEKKKESYKDPERRVTHTKAMNSFDRDEAYRSKQRVSSTRKWQDPEYRERLAESKRTVMNTPEYKAKQSQGSRERWANSEFRSAQCAKRKALWQDPEYRKNMLRNRKSKKAQKHTSPVLLDVKP